MTDDGRSASAERARRLREQIDRLKSGTAKPTDPRTEGPERPRDFVERRMREIAIRGRDRRGRDRSGGETGKSPLEPKDSTD